MLRYLPCFIFALWTRVVAEEYESPEFKGLMIDVTKRPSKCPLKAMKKDFVEVHYTTSIAKSSKSGKSGKKIDTSRDADGMNDPLSFQIGSDRVIPGWDHAMRDMCEGEVRVITIPPEHAYGEDGYSHKNADGEEVEIPADATLRLEAELIKIIRLQKEMKVSTKKCEVKSKPGDTVKVHYTLWIHPTSISGDKGAKVESSHDSTPMEFILGAGRVIPGWDQAMEGVCKGEKLELVVPPEFGYGTKGQEPKIPPMATLHFEIEILEVIETNMFKQMDSNNDSKIDIEELGVYMKNNQGLDDPEVVKQIFEGEDKNKDGFIDWDEAPFPKGERPGGSKTEEL
jgi:FKBP-type peptidyl-prolyl cis-trans isomerase